MDDQAEGVVRRLDLYTGTYNVQMGTECVMQLLMPSFFLGQHEASDFVFTGHRKVYRSGIGRVGCYIELISIWVTKHPIVSPDVTPSHIAPAGRSISCKLEVTKVPSIAFHVKMSWPGARGHEH